MPPAQPGDAAGDDFRLTKEDRLRLPAALAEMFPSQESATDFLTREMGIPAARIPLLRTSESVEDYWRRVLDQFDTEDVIEAPYHRLYRAVQERRGKSLLFDWIFRQFWLTDPQAEQATVPRVTGCHAIVRAENARIREVVRKGLEAEMLSPRQVWANHEMASFEVNETDVESVRDRINLRYAGLLIKVIPPGEPDDLISLVRVIDHDGQVLPLPDVPFQFTVAELGEAAARFHPARASTRTRPMPTADPGGQPQIEYAWHHGDGINGPVPLDGKLLQFKVGRNDRVTIDSLKFDSIRVVFVRASPRWNGGVQRGEVHFKKELATIREIARLGRIQLAGEFLNANRRQLAEILQLEPDILHIACHGNDTALYWEDDEGDPDSIPVAWLTKNIIERAECRLTGMLLSACAGEVIGPYLTGAASDVIAHRGPLADNVAANFATDFYTELAAVPVVRTAVRRANQDGSWLIFSPDAQGDSQR